jgi:Rrf2 family protein
MTLLSRKADYALLILSYLHDRPGTARAVADKFGLSRPFVANILKELCQHGFVASHRGVKGGYDLARPANSITLADLLETIEDGVRLTVCNPSPQDHNHDSCALSGTCTLKGPIAEVHARLLDVLRGVTLGELFEARVEPARPEALHALTILGSSVGTALRSAPA